MRRQEHLRSVSRSLQRLAMARLATPLDDGELRRSAMVFAPHPDDETLGCGGTILQKRRSGADVRIVFMTDGAASHAHLISRSELRLMRRREALEAVEALGLAPARSSWLDFPDAELSLWRAEAVTRVSRLLEQHRPQQVFLPYARGEHSDHVATHSIVYESIARLGLAATLLEYPVWSWRHWPVAGEGSSWGKARAVLAGCRATVCGVRFLRELRTSVAIQDVVAQKRAALERHVSQMRRRNGAPCWPTLGDVDQGEFLACFFQEYEYYRRVDFRGTARG
ncbi:PIG-L deacetylase family protein [Hyalangium gracile]|uniref:PIG-L deacetylase family protein n=1 Tax=Hyalangium gracile TaxID=394092 RepID=UPI003898F97E